MGEERAIQLLDAFFQMPDAELVKSKHPLVKLELKLQEVVVFADSGAFTPRAQASDVDREQADKLKKRHLEPDEEKDSSDRTLQRFSAWQVRNESLVHKRRIPRGV